MSDMSSERITIRIPTPLGDRLRSRSRTKGETESTLVRQALETYLGQTTTSRSAYDLAYETGLIGCTGRAPKDLSTNLRHMEEFGKSK